jgi:hypothetical protein
LKKLHLKKLQDQARVVDMLEASRKREEIHFTYKGAPTNLSKDGPCVYVKGVDMTFAEANQFLQLLRKYEVQKPAVLLLIQQMDTFLKTPYIGTKEVLPYVGQTQRTLQERMDEENKDGGGTSLNFIVMTLLKQVNHRHHHYHHHPTITTIITFTITITITITIIITITSPSPSPSLWRTEG